MKHTVQNTVFEQRTRVGITQEALADAVQVTRQTIIAIERGNYIPSVSLALKLATYFHSSVEELFQFTHTHNG